MYTLSKVSTAPMMGCRPTYRAPLDPTVLETRPSRQRCVTSVRHIYPLLLVTLDGAYYFYLLYFLLQAITVHYSQLTRPRAQQVAQYIYYILCILFYCLA